MTREYDEDAAAFLRQNPLAARTLSDDDVLDWAGHHAGGLVVLQSYLADGSGYFAKLHDSWGGDPNIVVHWYDPDDIDAVDNVEEFGDDGVAARDRFLDLVL